MKIFNQMELPVKLSNLDKKKFISWFFTSRITGSRISLNWEGVRVKNRNFTCKYPKSRRGSGLFHLKLRVIDSTADSRHLETRNSRCKNPNPF